MSSIDAFKREMSALASERPPTGPNTVGPAPRPSGGTVRAVNPDEVSDDRDGSVDVGGR